MAKPSKWRRRLLAAGLGLLAIAAAEILLAALGVAPPGLPPGELFGSAGPLFTRRDGQFHTSESRLAFFREESFAAEKPAGVKRVFIAGGSAAMGFPVEGVYSIDVLLERALSSSGGQFEVINAGGFGYASYRLLAVVDEILEYQPDAVVLMTGNNEYLEWRFGREDRSRIRGLFSRLRLFRVVEGAVAAARGDGGKVEWEAHRVTDRERELVAASFERSIDRIRRRCLARGVPLILVTCPTNLKDFRPYGDSRLALERMAGIDRLLAAGSFEAALFELEKEWDREEPDAWLAYEKGVALLAAGGDLEQYREAVALLRAARDLDPVPVRATSSLNQIVRQQAFMKGAHLADAEGLMDAKAEGPAGDGFFFDHCHPSWSGQRVLALSVLIPLWEAGVCEHSAVAALLEGGADRIFDAIMAEVGDEERGLAHYKIGFESGLNMRRARRGLSHAEKARKLDPSNPKAVWLFERLSEEALAVPALTGD